LAQNAKFSFEVRMLQSADRAEGLVSRAVSAVQMMREEAAAQGLSASLSPFERRIFTVSCCGNRFGRT
jgi:hypothetical protein